MANILNIITIVGASLIGLAAIGIIAQKTGLGDIFQIILKIVTEIFNWLRHFFSTTVIAAPPFIKVIFFLILIGFFGMFVNDAIGFNYACVGKILYKSNDLADVVALSAIPDTGSWVEGASAPATKEDIVPGVSGSTVCSGGITCGAGETSLSGYGSAYGYTGQAANLPMIVVPYYFDASVMSAIGTNVRQGDYGVQTTRLVYYICMNSNTQTCYLSQHICSNKRYEQNVFGYPPTGGSIDRYLYKVYISFLGDSLERTTVHVEPYGWLKGGQIWNRAIATQWLLYMGPKQLEECSTDFNYSLYYKGQTGEQIVPYKYQTPIEIKIGDHKGMVYDVAETPVTWLLEQQPTGLNTISDVISALDVTPKEAEFTGLLGEDYKTTREQWIAQNYNKTPTSDFGFSCVTGKPKISFVGVPIFSLEFMGTLIFIILILQITKFGK